MMGRTGWLALAASILGAPGGSACLTTGGYTCQSTADCDVAVSGRCEPNRVCSYPSEDCDGGRAYSQLGGALAGECVAGEGTGPTEGTSTSTPGSGSIGSVSTPGVDAASSSEPTEPGSAGTDEDCRYFPDADHDSFGLDDLEAVQCVPTDGHVDNRLDCDDTDDRVNPEGLDCDDNPGMIGWFRFNEGEMWRDSSGKGNDGAALSGSTVAIEPVDGPYGAAARFDSVEDGLNLGGVAQAFRDDDRFPAAGTLEVWVRDAATRTPAPGNSQLVLYFGRQDSEGFEPSSAQINLAVNGNVWQWQGWVSVSSSSGVECVTGLGSPEVVATNAWTHVAFSWEMMDTVGETGLYCSLYLNGERVLNIDSPMATVTGAVPIFGAAGRPLTLPAEMNADPRNFTGWLDEIMVFREARSSEQIRSDCGTPCE